LIMLSIYLLTLLKALSNDNASNLFIEIIESTINCTLHLSKDQPEDGPTIWPKCVVEIVMQYNLIKYKFVYDCITYHIF